MEWKNVHENHICQCDFQANEVIANILQALMR